MNKDVMSQLFSLMLDEQSSGTAVSLTSMLDELKSYRVELIIERFKHDVAPFTKVFDPYPDDAAFKGFVCGGANFGIDVVVRLDSYSFAFWDTNDRAGNQGRAKSVLERMTCLQDYRCSEGGLYSRDFKFPSQHDTLLEHMRAFKADLKRVATADHPA